MAQYSSPNLVKVISATLLASPGSPANGDLYLLPSTGTLTGAWAGANNKKFARYNLSTWEFISPFDGVLVWASDSPKIYQYKLSTDAWIEYSASVGITVREADGTPLVNNVTTIKVSNSDLTDEGGGTVKIKTASEASGGGGSGNTTGTGASSTIPSAATAGNLFFPTDGFSVARATGTIWENWGLATYLKSPKIADFSWVNQGSATASEKVGGIIMQIPTSSGENVRLIKKSLTATSNYTVVVGLVPTLIGSAFKNFGLALRDSTSGRILGLSIALTGVAVPNIMVYGWTNPTTYGGYNPISLAGFISFSGIIWLKIQDDGTNLLFSVGNTPSTFIQIGSTTRTAWLASADEVGLYMNQAATDFSSSCVFLSFTES